MSSASLAPSAGGVRAAWETEGRVYTSLLGTSFHPQAISGDKARHPSLAVNRRGEVLVAWSTGTGWQRGGNLAWQLLNPTGQPTQEMGAGPSIPVWSYPAAYASSEQDFVILH